MLGAQTRPTSSNIAATGLPFAPIAVDQKTDPWRAAAVDTKTDKFDLLIVENELPNAMDDAVDALEINRRPNFRPDEPVAWLAR